MNQMYYLTIQLTDFQISEVKYGDLNVALVGGYEVNATTNI